MRRVNVLEVELDERVDVAGFRHAEAPLTERLGAARIVASVYGADAGFAIWPYHYHHGIEEWLLVLSGAPVLREPAGKRALAAGDLAAFPSGRAGAHAAYGPGRFAIFSEGTEREPWETVYPDSDKVSGPEGMLLRGQEVGYWYREGTGKVDPEPTQRPPLALEGPPRPLVNVETIAAKPYREHEVRPGFRIKKVQLGPLLAAERLGATLYEVEPGEGTAPYHYEYGREEWVLVLAGAPTLRHPDGDDVLAAGDVVCFSEGPAGAHRLINRGDEPVRLIIFSTQGLPASTCYVDSGKWMIRNPPDGAGFIFRED